MRLWDQKLSGVFLVELLLNTAAFLKTLCEAS